MLSTRSGEGVLVTLVPWDVGRFAFVLATSVVWLYGWYGVYSIFSSITVLPPDVRCALRSSVVDVM